MVINKISIRKADSSMQNFKVSVLYNDSKVSKSLIFDLQTYLSQIYYECGDKLDMSDVSRNITDMLKLNYPKLISIQVECL